MCRSKPIHSWVQAKDKEGHPVTMLLAPDSFTEVMDMQSKALAPAGSTTSAEMANAGSFLTSRRKRT